MLRYRTDPQSDPFFWLYSHPRWLGHYDPAREFPFWINLEPTNVCQLDCLFCTRQISRRPLGYIDLYTVKAVAEETGAYPETAIRLAGWGEPLLHPRIVDIVETIKKAGLPLKIYTNGLALTAEMMRALVDLQVDDLQFSMQGLTPEQYEFNRQKSDFAAFQSRVRLAHAVRGSSPYPFISILTSVLEDEFQARSPESFADEWLQWADKVAVDLTNLNFVAETERARQYLDRQSPSLTRRPCVDIFLALEVKYDGNIEFCGQDADGRPEHTLGRVGEMTLREAFHSPRMEAHRDQVGRALGHDRQPVCRNCYHNTRKYDIFKSASST